MKKIWGTFLYGLAKFLDIVLGGLIKGLDWAVNAIQGIRQYLAPLLGCGFFFIIINPFTLLIFSNKVVWTIIFILMFFPLLGTQFVSLLAYGRYVLTEYLYDQADYYRYGRNTKRPFSSYGNKYRRKKMQEEQEKRRKAQEEKAAYWDQVFRNFTQQSGFWSTDDGSYYQNRNWGNGWGNTNSDYGTNQGYGNYGGYNTGSGFSNPFDSFKKQYEEACDTLGVPYDTDEYQVKLAYRKMAKKYHPDVNKSAGATEKFQQVNAAYDFLSKENIERYKNMS